MKENIIIGSGGTKVTKDFVQHININESEEKVAEVYVNHELIEELKPKKKSKKKKSKESRFIILLIRSYKVDKELKSEVKVLREIAKTGYLWFSDDLSDSLIFGKGDMNYDTIKNKILEDEFYKSKEYKVRKISV